MADEFDYLDSVCADLEHKAGQAGLEIHDSFILELQNYTLRRGMRRLSEATKAKVVEEVGSGAIEALRERKAVIDALGFPKASAQDVRLYLRDRCRDPFGLCYDEALRIVGESGSHEEMAELLRTLGRE